MRIGLAPESLPRQQVSASFKMAITMGDSYMGIIEDIVGNKFNRLTVLGYTHNGKNNRKFFDCLCDCGGRINTNGSAVRFGTTKSCGCLKRELATARNRALHTKHGLHLHPLYATWLSMIARCDKPGNNRYQYYGGRGITVCDRWRNSVSAFIQDVGDKPTPEHSIDRIDVNGNYEPGNVRWATLKEQRSNRQKHG